MIGSIRHRRMNISKGAISCLIGLTFLWLSLPFFSQPYEIDRTTRIPQAPLIESVSFEEMDTKNDSENPELVQELFNPDTLKVMDSVDLLPIGLDDDGLPLLWLLEVENFVRSDKAKAMTEKLRQKGHSAFTHIADDTDTTRYHVYIGPKIDRRRVVSEKTAIDKAFGTDALVLQFVR